MCLRTAWSEDRNRVAHKMMRPPVQQQTPWAGLGAQGWTLLLLNKIKSPFFTEPPYLLKRGGWTIWSNPKAYLA